MAFKRYLKNIMSLGLRNVCMGGGDINQLKVEKFTHHLDQIAIAKTEPGDENNQDISALVGKVDIRKLEHYTQNDADAYAYSAH